MSARRTVATAVLGVAAIGALSACGSADVTKARVEASLTPTFTNLYLQQQQLLGHPQVTAATMQASSSCDRGGPNVADTGAGRDWICMVTWNDDTGTSQQGKFELQVHSSSCWTANGPAKTIGSFTVTDTAGREVLNPVSAFDGCFDPDAQV
jgi:hypothetical protein